MLHWIVPYIKENKYRMILTVLLGVIGVTSGAMLLFTSGYLITKSSLRPENIMLVYVPIVATRAFSIAQALFLYLERLVGHSVVLRIVEKMRTKLYQVVEPHALMLRSKLQTGDILGVLSEDIEHIQNLYLKTIFPSLVAVVVYSILAIVLSFFDWAFAIMMLCLLGIIIFLLPFLSLLSIQKKHVGLKQGRSKLYQKFTDAVIGLSDWKASGRQAEFFTSYVTTEKKLVKLERDVKKFHHFRELIIQLVVGISLIAMILWSSNAANEGLITPTLIAAFVLMLLNLTGAMTGVSEAVEKIPAFNDSFMRIVNVEEILKDAESEDDNKKVKKDPSTILNEQIEFRNVTYIYPGTNRPVLKDLSLTIPKGKRVAILGRSGVGKSTLLKLLTGVVAPTSGEILINGKPVDSKLLGTMISVLNQKPHIFDTSIINNVRIGREEAEENEVIETLEKAKMMDVIQSLPDGIHTQMREMGKRFSGGERQRTAFARILLQNTPIILLDEPTIGLDPRTENDLLQTMFEAANNQTIIWVTHHLACIDKMDEIIFLDQGEISMQGSHQQLYATNERYRNLYNLDMGL